MLDRTETVPTLPLGCTGREAGPAWECVQPAMDQRLAGCTANGVLRCQRPGLHAYGTEWPCHGSLMERPARHTGVLFDTHMLPQPGASALGWCRCAGGAADSPTIIHIAQRHVWDRARSDDANAWPGPSTVLSQVMGPCVCVLHPTAQTISVCESLRGSLLCTLVDQHKCFCVSFCPPRAGPRPVWPA